MLDTLRERLEEPTSRGVADAISAMIRDGQLTDGEQLPSIRQIAETLQLSPSTVSAAWATLARAGNIHTDGRRGTRITDSGPSRPSRYRRALQTPTTFALDLATGIPDPLLLPDLGPALRQVRPAGTTSSYLDDPVLPALAEVLRQSWPHPPERLTVVDGAMDGLDLIARSWLRFGDRVAVEHPSFPPLLDLLEASGARVIGVGMDEDGMLASELRAALDQGVRAVFLQPRAQNPTGVSMSPARARQLVHVLQGSEALIVEDDSAGAIASSPLHSLSQWLPERTIHVRSFSKSHGPDLRLAAVGGPARILDPVNERRLSGQAWTSRLLQALLLELLTRPAAIRQVERARTQYAVRRRAIVEALAEHGITVGGVDGINIWLPVADETAALVRLASRGIGAAAGAPFAARPERSAHIRVTTGLVSADHRQLAAELAAASRLGAWASLR